MAETNISVEKDQFSCPICLDLLKDPVTTACGHSYCMGCIKDCWDQDDQKQVYSCPQCRQTFVPRPVLNKNTMLAELVEKLMNTDFQDTSYVRCYDGMGNVDCDICTEEKLRAVKSCLVCLTSYCESHLKLHDDLNPGKKHKVIDATEQLKAKICCYHDKLLEIYCRTDNECICYLCTVDEHKGHDTVSAAAEKQNVVSSRRGIFQQKIQATEKEVEQLSKSIMSLKQSAMVAVEGSDRIFAEVIHSLKRRCTEVRELIRAQEKAEVSQAEELLGHLEQEVAELRRRDAELEQLSCTEDHVYFLQNYKGLCDHDVSEELPGTTINPGCDFGMLGKMVVELKKQLDSYCEEEVEKILTAVKAVHILESVKPSQPAVKAVHILESVKPSQPAEPMPQYQAYSTTAYPETAAGLNKAKYEDNRWSQVDVGRTYGGESYGGESYGGVSYGGVSYGGESYGGVSYGGVSYGGESFRGQFFRENPSRRQPSGGGPSRGSSGGGHSRGGPSGGGHSRGGSSGGGPSGGGPSRGGSFGGGPSGGGHSRGGSSGGGPSGGGHSRGGSSGGGPSGGGHSRGGSSGGGSSGGGPSRGGSSGGGPSRGGSSGGGPSGGGPSRGGSSGGGHSRGGSSGGGHSKGGPSGKKR